MLFLCVSAVHSFLSLFHLLQTFSELVTPSISILNVVRLLLQYRLFTIIQHAFFVCSSQFLITFFICCSQFLITFLSAAHSFLSFFYLLLTVSYHFFISAANFFQSWSHQVHTLAWHGPHRHSTGLVGSEPRNPIFLCPPQPHGTRQHPGAQLHTSAFLHQQQLPAAGALHTEQNLHDGGRVGCLEETDCWPGHDAGDQASGLVSSDYNLNPVRFRAPHVLVMARLKASLNIADYRKQIADLVMMGLVSSDSHQKPSEA